MMLSDANLATAANAVLCGVISAIAFRVGHHVGTRAGHRQGYSEGHRDGGRLEIYHSKEIVNLGNAINEAGARVDAVSGIWTKPPQSYIPTEKPPWWRS